MLYQNFQRSFDSNADRVRCVVLHSGSAGQPLDFMLPLNILYSLYCILSSALAEYKTTVEELLYAENFFNAICIEITRACTECTLVQYSTLLTTLCTNVLNRVHCITLLDIVNIELDCTVLYFRSACLCTSTVYTTQFFGEVCSFKF